MEMSGPIARTVIKRWQAGSWEARREDPHATLPVEDNKNSKELRRLIVQLERRRVNSTASATSPTSVSLTDWLRPVRSGLDRSKAVTVAKAGLTTPAAL
jgi:hypothetical protein